MGFKGLWGFLFGVGGGVGSFYLNFLFKKSAQCGVVCIRTKNEPKNNKTNPKQQTQNPNSKNQ